jgi:hypothetical protein
MTYTLAFTPKPTDLDIKLVSGLPLMSWLQAHKAAGLARGNGFDVVVFNTESI